MTARIRKLSSRRNRSENSHQPLRLSVSVGVRCFRDCEWERFKSDLSRRISDVQHKLNLAFNSGVHPFEALSSEDDDFLAELRDHAPGRAADLLRHVAEGCPDRTVASVEGDVFRFYSLRHRVVEAERVLLGAVIEAAQIEFL